MRKGGDHRSDVIVKSEILDEILARGHDIAFVVDDRPRVVEMWRQRGLTCLQCRDWEERKKPGKAVLTLMVGPSGAGKSYWLRGDRYAEYEIHPSHIVSSDQIRQDLCGDFRDQSRNDEVFTALHAVAKERLRHGLPTVIDATNLRRKDRLACVELNAGGPVHYIVIDRPMEEKRRDAGWRAELPFDLLAKHDQTFRSQEKEILAGDGLSNVTVIDMRGK
jgi:predicted kinase